MLFIGSLETIDLLFVIIELFSLDITAEALQADLKIGISEATGHLYWPKFPVEKVIPHHPFFLSEN